MPKKAIKKSKTRTAIVATLAAGMTALGAMNLDNYTDFTGRDIAVETQNGELDVPVYNLFTGLRPGRCSAYVRKAADDLFEMSYSFSDAWDRVYNDKIITGLDSFNSLENLISDGTMNPGNLVGAVYPNSPNMEGLDSQGNPRQFSHLLLYLGKSPEGDPIFTHRISGKTHIDTLSHFEPNGYKAKYLLAPKD